MDKLKALGPGCSLTKVSACFFLRVMAILFVVFGFSLAFAQEFYRYKDDQGQTVLDTKIPVEYSAAGYDVLDSRGQLIERVAPAREISAEESALLNQSAAIQASDQILLTSYSTTDEIEAHRDRKLLGLSREVEIIESDQEVVQDELDKALIEASEFEEDEEPVPEEVSSLIASLSGTIQQLGEQLISRQNEFSETELEFNSMVERFKEIKGLREQDAAPNP